MARPTKYTPERIKAILEALESGMGRVGAAEYGGISFETFCQWMKRPEFSEGVTRAESRCELWMVGNIKKAAATDWRAAFEWLRVRRPQEWGKQQDGIDLLALVREMAKAQGLSPSAEEAAVREVERYLQESRRGSRV